MVLKATRVLKVILVTREHRATKVPKEIPAIKVLKVILVTRVLKAIRDQLGRLEPKAL